jgi:hypothetical protein
MELNEAILYEQLVNAGYSTDRRDPVNGTVFNAGEGGLRDRLQPHNFHLR